MSRKRVVLGAAFVAAFVVVTAGIPAGGDLLTAETFQDGAVANGAVWAGNGAGGAATGWPGQPCLTVGGNTAQTPIPQCNLTIPDAAGTGALRLTGADGGRSGAVFNTQALTTAGGLDISFHQAQYGGTTFTQAPNPPRSADGISFFLVDGSSTSTAAGGTGPGLGYASVRPPGTTSTGVASGLLGIGLDAFGNFSHPAAGGTTCPGGSGGGPGNIFNVVTIRGPGDGNDGYCWLGSSGTLSTTTFPMGDATSGTGTRATRDILVRIVFDPANSTGATRNVTVFLNGTQVVQIPAPLELLAATSFKFGFAASTGAGTDVHEVWGLVINSVASLAAPPLPPRPPTVTAHYMGPKSIVVNFTVSPPSGGPVTSPVTGFTATATNGTTTKTCVAPASATSCTIPDLPPGTYRVTVTAESAAGSSAPSDPITVIVPAGSVRVSFTG